MANDPLVPSYISQGRACGPAVVAPAPPRSPVLSWRLHMKPGSGERLRTRASGFVPGRPTGRTMHPHIFCSERTLKQLETPS